MTAHATRRELDIQKLQALSGASNGKIRISSINGNPPSTVNVELLYPTAGNKSYPSSIQKSTQIVIELGAKYPFSEPRVVIKTPILHPNVYASGQVCLGAKWLPTQGLDLLVKRIISIVTYDPAILNENSPANRDALTWYIATQKQHPLAFPTTSSNTNEESQKAAAISWSNVK